ncbi:heavy metal-associated isoprenylated plant protein 41-like [Macadamia integrifolia]|uniref:heavy metal-associated isoprenylated plant protein 41-like n=1 Tax=Macadamia integrifolia TaxID=60698 RepID=UPI001C4F9731|nr:heavy metal-associated isoprenylated plant protein 41-like [Macadamia integrifolia]
MVKHPTARANLEELEKLGCIILHEVDCHTMNRHPFLKTMKFDRIIFNFPHAGFYQSELEQEQIELHQEVMKGFFRSARDMLKAKGEAHVTHKTSYPYNKWDLEILAGLAGLCLAEEVEFIKQDYPGYDNKRGDGDRSNDSFRVGMCSTYKFILQIREEITCTPFDAVACPYIDVVACMWLDQYDPIRKPRPRRTRSKPIFSSNRSI